MRRRRTSSPAGSDLRQGAQEFGGSATFSIIACVETKVGGRKAITFCKTPFARDWSRNTKTGRSSCCRPKGRDASPRRPKHPLKANSWDGSESHPYQLKANASARARCRSQSRACAAQRYGWRFLLPSAPATSADACSADNQPARCVSPDRRGWRAGSIF
jgi:hypothetical protein